MAFFFNKVLDPKEFSKLVNDLPEGTTEDRQITRITLENETIATDDFKNIHFKDCKWDNVDAHGKTFENIIFENCEFTNVDMRKVHLINVQYIQSKLDNVVMNNAKLEHVNFKNSKLTSSDPNIDNSYNGIQADEILFDDSDLTGIGFYRGKGVFRFDNSRLYDVSGQSLSEGSSLYFHNTKASQINFDRSNLNNLEIIDSTIENYSTANGCNVGNIFVRNSNLDFPIANLGNTHSIVFEGSGNAVVGGGINVKSTKIKDCPEGTRYITVGGKNFGEIYIENCHASSIYFSSSEGSLVSIKNSSAYEIDFRKSKIDHLILDNVEVATSLTYHKSNIRKLDAKDITFEKGIEISNDDSNIEIKPNKILETE